MEVGLNTEGVSEYEYELGRGESLWNGRRMGEFREEREIAGVRKVALDFVAAGCARYVKDVDWEVDAEVNDRGEVSGRISVKGRLGPPEEERAKKEQDE